MIKSLNHELAEYDTGVAAKPQLLVITKLDAVHENGVVEALEDYAATEGVACQRISAVRGDGLQTLVQRISVMLDQLVPAPPAQGGSLG